MASTGQALAHLPQRMQRFLRTITPPSLRWLYAPVGQASAQGAGSQATHVLATKPVESPPDEPMRIPAVSHERFLCIRRAQAKEQEWQPMQRSILGVVKIFMLSSPSFSTSISFCLCSSDVPALGF